MAKKQKPDGEAEGGEAKKGLPKKALIGGALALVLALGGGGWFMFGRGHADAPKAEAKKPAAFVDLPEMVINLAAAGQDRQQFLKLKVSLELGDPKQVPEVQPMLPRVQDMFQVFMRELRPADLEGSAGLYRLKEEMTRRVNVAVYPAKVEAVLLKEMLVQ